MLDQEGIKIVTEAFRARCEAAKGGLVEIGAEPDHVHALISLPPSVPVSILVNAVKTNSSRKLREQFPALRERGGAFWSPSYFVVSCGGAPLEQIREYVRGQEAPREQDG